MQRVESNEGSSEARTTLSVRCCEVLSPAEGTVQLRWTGTEPKPRGTHKTHVHDLPDECLVEILNRLHVSYCLLPSMHTYVKVEHPVHCALVCKRWHTIADAAVRALQLHHPHPLTRTTHALVQKVVNRFTNLSALSLSKELGGDALLLLADSTPRLQQLVLGSRSPIPAMTQALAKWTSLTRLDLDRILRRGDIGGMFHAISKLPSLRHLRFRYFGDSLSTVCTHVDAMSSLATLDIQCARFPPASSETVRWAKALRKLTLLFFMGAHLSSALGLVEKLETLSLERAWGLTTLLESIGCLLHLTTLSLCRCWDLTSLPSRLGMVTGLKNLTIVGCFQLEALPESLRNLASLKSCTLMELGSLRALPEGVSEWRSLTRLTVKDCDSLQELPRGLGQLYALKELSLSGCSLLRSLPRGIGELRCLTDLDVSDCGALTELPETIEELSGLRLLGVDQALKLPESHKCRSSLEILRY